MTWLTMFLVISFFILMIISAFKFFPASKCCETNSRDVISVIGLIGLIGFSIFTLIYSGNSGRDMKITEITPTYFGKSKTQVYIEFDYFESHSNYKYSDAKTYNELNDSSKFYLVEYKNHWNFHYYEIERENHFKGLKKEEFNKWIKNRW